MKSAEPFYRLMPHSETRWTGIDCIDVTVIRRSENEVHLRYYVECTLDHLVLSDPVSPERTDGLWRTTCFELFVSRPDSRYLEYNFSPSSAWAAYRFSGHRSNMELLDCEAPVIALDASEGHFALEAECRLPDAFAETGCRIALSAVIEETGGTKSYWALRHPPGAPDFHHPDCFALTLEAPPPA